MRAVEGKAITTIEGLSADRSHAVQQAWIELDVPAVRLLPVGPDHVRRGAAANAIPDPSDADIDAAMAGNICRCGTYPRIRKAIHRAAELMTPEDATP